MRGAVWGGRTRRRVEVRLDEILNVTLAEIERVGLASVRVSDVAQALGVSTGLVFYHFNTRDELVAQAFSHAVELDLVRMRKAAAKAHDAAARVRAVLRTSGPTGSAAGWRLWVDGWALAQREPHVAAELRRLAGEYRAELQAAIEAGVAAGDLRCPDPASSAARLGALLDGMSVAVTVQRSMTRKQLRQWMEEAVDRELGLG